MDPMNSKNKYFLEAKAGKIFGQIDKNSNQLIDRD